MLTALMCVTSATTTKTSYEILTEALQLKAAQTLSSIAKALLSAEAKSFLLKDVATKPQDGSTTAPAPYAQTTATTEPQQDEDSSRPTSEQPGEPEAQDDHKRLAALLVLADTFNEKLAASQLTANNLNNELDRILNLEQKPTETVA